MLSSVNSSVSGEVDGGKVDKLLQTLYFAAKAHKSQKRKGDGGVPYINHLIEVATLLSLEAGVTDIEVLQAAVLHDVLEDTPVTLDELNDVFGERVAGLIEAVTDDKSLSLEQRRQKQVDMISCASPEVKLIKLADHCSNIVCIPDTWVANRVEQYKMWSFEVASKCFSISDRLAKIYLSRK